MTLLLALTGALASTPAPPAPELQAPIARMRQQQIVQSGWDLWVKRPTFDPPMNYDFTQRSAPLVIYGTKEQIELGISAISGKKFFVSASHDRSGQHEDRLIDEWLDPDIELCVGYRTVELENEQLKLALDTTGEVLLKLVGGLSALAPTDALLDVGGIPGTVKTELEAVKIHFGNADANAGSGVFLHAYEITPLAKSGYRCISAKTDHEWEQEGGIYGAWIKGSDLVTALKASKNPSSLK